MVRRERSEREEEEYRRRCEVNRELMVAEYLMQADNREMCEYGVRYMSKKLVPSSKEEFDLNTSKSCEKLVH